MGSSDGDRVLQDHPKPGGESDSEAEVEAGGTLHEFRSRRTYLHIYVPLNSFPGYITNTFPESHLLEIRPRDVKETLEPRLGVGEEKSSAVSTARVRHEDNDE